MLRVYGVGLELGLIGFGVCGLMRRWVSEVLHPLEPQKFLIPRATALTALPKEGTRNT